MLILKIVINRRRFPDFEHLQTSFLSIQPQTTGFMTGNYL